MSVVAARVYADRIVMAADSIVVQGWSKNTSGNFVKMQRINDMIVGSCGSAQDGSLMWHYMSTHKPAAPTEKAVLEFMVEFMRWKRDLTGDGAINNVYLLAYAGHLFSINNTLVYEVKEYEAIGAGMDYSNTALHLGHTPREAVKVACDLCCYVAEPIVEYTMTR